MKILFFFIIIFLVYSSEISAQKMDAKKFHKHRTNIRNAATKFEKEKTGRVAFLGGSITHNPGWRDSVCTYLQKQYPDTEFDFINAGIPSMGSTPGAFRFERDVLKNGKADLLFLEAAVNDDTNQTSPDEITRGMEGIVRHAKNANPNCDIIIMHFVDPGKMDSYNKGEVPEVIRLHEKVAEHYNISTINLAKEVTERINAGEFSWENDFKNLHPSPFGQNIYYQSIKAFLENELVLINSELEKDKNYILPTPLDQFSYSNGVLIEVNPPKEIKGWQFEKNWIPNNEIATRENYADVPMLVGDFPGKILKFQFKGNAVGIAVAAGPDAGIIEYSVDESKWIKVDLFTPWSKNLYIPWYCTLDSGLKNRKHTLQIRLTGEKNPESIGTKCIIRYFYYNKAE